MALVKKSCKIGGLECEVWIVEIEKDKFMYGGHGVAKCLGYKQPKDAIRVHVKPAWRKNWEEIKEANMLTIKTPHNWQSNTVFINEAGVYSLIMRSKLQSADLFREWLFEEVLPELRRTGRMLDSFCNYSESHKRITQTVMEYVYFITSPVYRLRHVYKIGTTRTPTKRVRQLNCGRPFDLLELDHCTPAHQFGLVVETMLLNEYKTQLLHGEWVQFTDREQYEQAKKKLFDFIATCRSCYADSKPEANVSSLLAAI